jgi:hypothetical protein
MSVLATDAVAEHPAGSATGFGHVGFSDSQNRDAAIRFDLS